MSPVTTPYGSPCLLRRSRSPIPSILWEAQLWATLWKTMSIFVFSSMWTLHFVMRCWVTFDWATVNKGQVLRCLFSHVTRSLFWSLFWHCKANKVWTSQRRNCDCVHPAPACPCCIPHAQPPYIIFFYILFGGLFRVCNSYKAKCTHPHLSDWAAHFGLCFISVRPAGPRFSGFSISGLAGAFVCALWAYVYSSLGA